MSMDKYKLWGGCFELEPAEVLQRLNRSLGVDQRLYREDIQGSKAYAEALCDARLISEEEMRSIIRGLEEVQLELEEEITRTGGLSDCDEDIHTVIEKRLAARVGAPALKLHTGRSRNDQSATDTTLWLLNATPALDEALRGLVQTLNTRALNEIEVIMPGYTHLQRGQPVRWSHFLLSHAWSARDDSLRLREQRARLSRCPLGSGALAGCAFPLDRRALARRLGYGDVTPNSMFAVGNRDYIVEFLNWAALCGSHLSRISEDLIIFSTQEFGFVRLSDAFSTGSSLMPQKRNPDGLELVRGAAGALLGAATGFSTSLKGLPSTYNKDLQSDKETIFRSYDRLLGSLQVLTGTIATLTINPDRMKAALDSSMLATDVAHALVRRGVPFRTAHHLSGRALRRAAELDTDLAHLPPHEFKAICEQFPDDMSALWSWEHSVEQYAGEGGTARASVRRQIELIQEWLQTEAN